MDGTDGGGGDRSAGGNGPSDEEYGLGPEEYGDGGGADEHAGGGPDAGGDSGGGTVSLPVLGEVSTVAAVLGALAVLVLALPVLIAVVVIGAAVLGTFVIGIGGESVAETPQAAFDFEYDGSELVVAHAGGETFTGENTRRLVLRSDSGGVLAEAELPFAAGSVMTTGDVDSGDVVRVVWTGPDRDRSEVLASFEVP